MGTIGISRVYCIFNKQTGDKYVGSTAQLLSKRKADHFYRLKHNKHYSQKMQDDYNAYGEDSFTVFELEEVRTFERDNLFEREQFWIDKYKPEYNVNPKAGNTFTDYAKERARNAKPRLGKKQSNEEKQKRSKSLREYYFQKGEYHISEAQKKHLSEINMGKGNPNFGKKQSQETILKRTQTRIKKNNYSFISPNGEVHTNVKNVSIFAKLYELDYFGLRHLIQGKIKSHKGWRIESSTQ